ncbi:serine-rich adhesin for platelets-like isoform X1 [Cherax quadricarinatus]
MPGAHSSRVDEPNPCGSISSSPLATPPADIHTNIDDIDNSRGDTIGGGTASLPLIGPEFDPAPQKRKGNQVKRRSQASDHITNGISPILDSEASFEKILKNLFENTALHEKIAENINRGLSSQSKTSGIEDDGGDEESCATTALGNDTSGSNSNKNKGVCTSNTKGSPDDSIRRKSSVNYSSMISIGDMTPIRELDHIVSETTADPAFESLLDEVFGSGTPQSTSLKSNGSSQSNNGCMQDTPLTASRLLSTPVPPSTSALKQISMLYSPTSHSRLPSSTPNNVRSPMSHLLPASPLNHSSVSEAAHNRSLPEVTSQYAQPPEECLLACSPPASPSPPQAVVQVSNTSSKTSNKKNKKLPSSEPIGVKGRITRSAARSFQSVACEGSTQNIAPSGQKTSSLSSPDAIPSKALSTNSPVLQSLKSKSKRKNSKSIKKKIKEDENNLGEQLLQEFADFQSSRPDKLNECEGGGDSGERESATPRKRLSKCDEEDQTPTKENKFNACSAVPKISGDVLISGVPSEAGACMAENSDEHSPFLTGHKASVCDDAPAEELATAPSISCHVSSASPDKSNNFASDIQATESVGQKSDSVQESLPVTEPLHVLPYSETLEILEPSANYENGLGLLTTVPSAVLPVRSKTIPGIATSVRVCNSQLAATRNDNYTLSELTPVNLEGFPYVEGSYYVDEGTGLLYPASMQNVASGNVELAGLAAASVCPFSNSLITRNDSAGLAPSLSGISVFTSRQDEQGTELTQHVPQIINGNDRDITTILLPPIPEEAINNGHIITFASGQENADDQATIIMMPLSSYSTLPQFFGMGYGGMSYNQCDSSVIKTKPFASQQTPRACIRRKITNAWKKPPVLIAPKCDAPRVHHAEASVAANGKSEGTFQPATTYVLPNNVSFSLPDVKKTDGPLQANNSNKKSRAASIKSTQKSPVGCKKAPLGRHVDMTKIKKRGIGKAGKRTKRMQTKLEESVLSSNIVATAFSFALNSVTPVKANEVLGTQMSNRQSDIVTASPLREEEPHAVKDTSKDSSLVHNSCTETLPHTFQNDVGEDQDQKETPELKTLETGSHNDRGANAEIRVECLSDDVCSTKGQKEISGLNLNVIQTYSNDSSDFSVNKCNTGRSPKLKALLQLSQSISPSKKFIARTTKKGSQSTPSYKNSHVRVLDFSTPQKCKIPSRAPRKAIANLKFSPPLNKRSPKRTVKVPYSKPLNIAKKIIEDKDAGEIGKETKSSKKSINKELSNQKPLSLSRLKQNGVKTDSNCSNSTLKSDNLDSVRGIAQASKQLECQLDIEEEENLVLRIDDDDSESSDVETQATDVGSMELIDLHSKAGSFENLTQILSEEFNHNQNNEGCINNSKGFNTDFILSANIQSENVDSSNVFGQCDKVKIKNLNTPCKAGELLSSNCRELLPMTPVCLEPTTPLFPGEHGALCQEERDLNTPLPPIVSQMTADSSPLIKEYPRGPYSNSSVGTSYYMPSERSLTTDSDIRSPSRLETVWETSVIENLSTNVSVTNSSPDCQKIQLGSHISSTKMSRKSMGEVIEKEMVKLFSDDARSTHLNVQAEKSSSHSHCSTKIELSDKNEKKIKDPAKGKQVNKKRIPSKKYQSLAELEHSEDEADPKLIVLTNPSVNKKPRSLKNTPRTRSKVKKDRKLVRITQDNFSEPGERSISACEQSTLEARILVQNTVEDEYKEIFSSQQSTQSTNHFRISARRKRGEAILTDTDKSVENKEFRSTSNEVLKQKICNINVYCESTTKVSSRVKEDKNSYSGNTLKKSIFESVNKDSKNKSKTKCTHVNTKLKKVMDMFGSDISLTDESESEIPETNRIKPLEKNCKNVLVKTKKTPDKDLGKRNKTRARGRGRSRGRCRKSGLSTTEPEERSSTVKSGRATKGGQVANTRQSAPRGRGKALCRESISVDEVTIEVVVKDMNACTREPSEAQPSDSVIVNETNNNRIRTGRRGRGRGRKSVIKNRRHAATSPDMTTQIPRNELKLLDIVEFHELPEIYDYMIEGAGRDSEHFENNVHDQSLNPNHSKNYMTPFSSWGCKLKRKQSKPFSSLSPKDLKARWSSSLALHSSTSDVNITDTEDESPNKMWRQATPEQVIFHTRVVKDNNLCVRSSSGCARTIIYKKDASAVSLHRHSERELGEIQNVTPKHSRHQRIASTGSYSVEYVPDLACPTAKDIYSDDSFKNELPSSVDPLISDQLNLQKDKTGVIVTASDVPLSSDNVKDGKPTVLLATDNVGDSDSSVRCDNASGVQSEIITLCAQDSEGVALISAAAVASLLNNKSLLEIEKQIEISDPTCRSISTCEIDANVSQKAAAEETRLRQSTLLNSPEESNNADSPPRSVESTGDLWESSEKDCLMTYKHLPLTPEKKMGQICHSIVKKKKALVAFPSNIVMHPKYVKSATSPQHNSDTEVFTTGAEDTEPILSMNKDKSRKNTHSLHFEDESTKLSSLDIKMINVNSDVKRISIFHSPGETSILKHLEDNSLTLKSIEVVNADDIPAKLLGSDSQKLNAEYDSKSNSEKTLIDAGSSVSLPSEALIMNRREPQHVQIAQQHEHNQYLENDVPERHSQKHIDIENFNQFNDTVSECLKSSSNTNLRENGGDSLNQNIQDKNVNFKQKSGKDCFSKPDNNFDKTEEEEDSDVLRIEVPSENENEDSDEWTDLLTLKDSNFIDLFSLNLENDKQRTKIVSDKPRKRQSMLKQLTSKTIESKGTIKGKVKQNLISREKHEVNNLKKNVGRKRNEEGARKNSAQTERDIQLIDNEKTDLSCRNLQAVINLGDEKLNYDDGICESSDKEKHFTNRKRLKEDSFEEMSKLMEKMEPQQSPHKKRRRIQPIKIGEVEKYPRQSGKLWLQRKRRSLFCELEENEAKTGRESCHQHGELEDAIFNLYETVTGPESDSLRREVLLGSGNLSERSVSSLSSASPGRLLISESPRGVDTSPTAHTDPAMVTLHQSEPAASASPFTKCQSAKASNLDCLTTQSTPLAATTPQVQITHCKPSTNSLERIQEDANADGEQLSRATNSYIIESETSRELEEDFGCGRQRRARHITSELYSGGSLEIAHIPEKPLAIMTNHESEASSLHLSEESANSFSSMPPTPGKHLCVPPVPVAVISSASSCSSDSKSMQQPMSLPLKKRRKLVSIPEIVKRRQAHKITRKIDVKKFLDKIHYSDDLDSEIDSLCDDQHLAQNNSRKKLN